MGDGRAAHGARVSRAVLPGYDRETDQHQPRHDAAGVFRAHFTGLKGRRRLEYAAPSFLEIFFLQRLLHPIEPRIIWPTGFILRNAAAAFVFHSRGPGQRMLLCPVPSPRSCTTRKSLSWPGPSMCPISCNAVAYETSSLTGRMFWTSLAFVNAPAVPDWDRIWRM
jgi:hypothetical protein